MLSLSQLLERVLSRRGLQGGEPGGVAGGPGGCSQLAGCTSPCQSQQSRVTRACHRAQPRLRASAAIYHRTFQGRGCLSMGKANRASAVARSWGSGSSIMARTERSSEDRPAVNSGGKYPWRSCCQPSPPWGSSMLQATSKMVRPRLGRTGREDKKRQSQLCDTDPSPIQHPGGKGPFSSTINHRVSEKGVRSFEESPGGPVSTSQDGYLEVWTLHSSS